MLKTNDQILAQTLLDRKLITQQALVVATKEAYDKNEPLAMVLLERGLVDEVSLMKVLAEQLKMEIVDIKNIQVDKELLEKIPVKFSWYYKFFPIKLEGNTLTIAVAYPLDIKTQDEIRVGLGYDIHAVLSSKNDIIEMLKRNYGLAADTIEKIISRSADSSSSVGTAFTEQQEVENIEKLAGDASVIQLVNQIILEAFKKRATDIHIEPYRDKIKLRYRIDGVLYDAKVPPEIKRFFMPILSRIKIMSNLNIVERRLPQDGRAIVNTKDQTLDLRVSSIPTPYGESIVIRLLPTLMMFGLEKLGLSENDLKIFESLLKKPHGIIFVTGPTGSGKTTTLYACLSRLNTPDKKIISIEDPIEYELEGITQIQVMPEIGLTFARGLRSMLRHDPDVMMVGEVRDQETAEITIRVALTGHLVLSTLHTNDAASGITRLIDIGIEPFLIASSVEAFIAQRLVRVICPHCKELDKRPMLELKQKIAKSLQLKSAEEVKFYVGKGCQECDFTGFFGRTAIYEILLMNEQIRELVIQKAPAKIIKQKAVSEGMRILRQDGWAKVIAGITTPEEVLKATPDDKDLEEALNTKEDKIVESRSEPAVSTAFDTAKLQTPPSKTIDLQQNIPPEAISGVDKREFIRLNERVDIQFRVFEPGSSSSKASAVQKFTKTKNVSAGGLLFISNEQIPLGTILELKINLPDATGTIECLGRVIRIEQKLGEETFDVAVCFLDLTSAQRAQLDAFIKERRKQ